MWPCKAKSTFRGLMFWGCRNEMECVRYRKARTPFGEREIAVTYHPWICQTIICSQILSKMEIIDLKIFQICLPTPTKNIWFIQFHKNEKIRLNNVFKSQHQNYLKLKIANHHNSKSCLLKKINLKKSFFKGRVVTIITAYKFISWWIWIKFSLFFFSVVKNTLPYTYYGKLYVFRESLN